MPILKNVEMYYIKCNPKRPNNTFDKKQPTWEVQLRTTSKDQKNEWINAGLQVRAVVPDDGEPYFRVNLRKRSIKNDGEKALPVEVVDGALEPVDPDTIGNGSIGNVRVLQRTYMKEGGGTGIANTLVGIQVIKHIVYKPVPHADSFEETTTERIELADDVNENEEVGTEDDDDDFVPASANKPTKAVAGF